MWGYTISDSGKHLLQLLPRTVGTIEVKRHISTVTVKLARTQTNFNRLHIYCHLVTTSICYTSKVSPQSLVTLPDDD